MTGRTAQQKRGGTGGRPVKRRSAAARRRWARYAGIALAVIAVTAALYGVFRTTNPAPTGTASTGGTDATYPYAVGQPGPGQPAPGFTLASTAGSQQSLTSLRGKTVLLYFQEGLMCQPCWDQISDLERNAAAVHTAGVDQIISITTDPIDLVTRKMQDLRLSTPVLSDPDLAVSKTYHANEYGMMGTSRDGHTFILVRPDGTIAWRADYGGAPKYTMFVPTDRLLADLKAGATR